MLTKNAVRNLNKMLHTHNYYPLIVTAGLNNYYYIKLHNFLLLLLMLFYYLSTIYHPYEYDI